MGKILITGITGLIGKQLSCKLFQQGSKVVGLSRKANEKADIPIYKWDVEKGMIDDGAFDSIDTIIHLAGAPIADKRWTLRRKKVIYNSRIESTRLLVNAIIKNELPVKTFIGASAIGIYGNRGNEWLSEESSVEKNWLASVCKDWEAAINPLREKGLRTASVRIGIVLSAQGGALSKILPPIKKGLNAVLGNGQQFYSWIHIDDVVGVIEKISNDENLFGVFNAVAPNPVTFETLVTTIADILNKKAIKLPAPKLFLQLAMGNMSCLLTDSARVSADRIIKKGYAFEYPKLEQALKELLIS